MAFWPSLFFMKSHLLILWQLPPLWWVIFLFLLSRFFSLTFNIFTDVYGCGSLFYTLSLLSSLDIWICGLFIKFLKFSPAVSSSIFSVSFSFFLSSPSGTPTSHMLMCWMVSHISLSHIPYFTYVYMFNGMPYFSNFFLCSFLKIPFSVFSECVISINLYSNLMIFFAN